MSMKAMETLRDTLCSKLDEYSRKAEMKAGDLEIIHMLTDTIKNIDKICMLADQGYSQAIEYDGGGSYNRGNSYANRGQHYVRGHYSRDGGQDGGYSGLRRDRDKRYSQADGRSEMMEYLEMALDSANEQDRESLKRFMQKL